MQFTRKSNKRKNRIIFLSVLAAVLVILTVSSVLLMRRAASAQAPEENSAALTPILPEEGRYGSYPLAYPQVDKSSIKLVSIDNDIGSYFMAIPANSSSDLFEFYYDFDENGDAISYYPDILADEDGMEYDEFYAKVTGDGYDRIPMLDYLVMALRIPYFDYRVYLDENPEKREAQLKTYGLSSETKTEPADSEESSTVKLVRFMYINDDGTLGAYQIEIGAHTLTGSGYYFRVSDGVYKGDDEIHADGKLDKYFDFTPREYIYVTRETNYFKYALLGVEAYINPTLIASGLENDQHALYAPYLTPDYRQWKTELHQLGALPGDYKEIKKNVTELFADIDLYSPSSTQLDGAGHALAIDNLNEYVLNLTEMKDNPLYSYFIKALAGRELGTQSFSQSLLVEKDVTQGTKYRYIISDVNAIITAKGERTDSAPANLNDGEQYVRVTYKLQVWDESADGGNGGFVDVKNVTIETKDEDGKVSYSQMSAPTQGILDLKYLKKLGISKEVIEDLSVVGDSTAEIILAYDQAVNSKLSEPEELSYFLDEVLEIYETERDKDGNLISYKRTNTLTDTCFVIYRYYYRTDDNKNQTAQIGYIDMKSDPDEADHERKDKIRLAVKGWMSMDSDIELKVLTEYVYADIMSDFLMFHFKNITGYVTGEIISAFRFVNASERDPFYGESFYERGGSEEESRFMGYAMDQNACETVVKLLGGVAETSKADGLIGKETVKVGIDSEAIEHYIFRLGKEGGEIQSAHTIRFALPRELYVSKETEEDELDDYGWLRTVDFVLYISQPVFEDETNTWIRYVASEAYNIIVKIEAEELGFVDLDTVDFWARRDLMLIDSKYIKSMELTFSADDIKGQYYIEIAHRPYLPPNAVTEYDVMYVHVQNTGSSNFKTKYDEYVEYNSSLPQGTQGKEFHPTLEGFYNWLAGGPVRSDNDDMGTGMFKEFLLILYFTKYMGTLTEQEQEEAVKQAPLLSIKMTLDTENNPSAKDTLYVYDFYRCDDRRVMVSLSERDPYTGELLTGTGYSRDFYITSLAFEKIAVNFIGLLNGETLDENDPYPDFSVSGT